MLPTITVRNVRYRVERIANPEWFLLPVRFVLHDPRGRRWLLMLSKERPDRLLACPPINCTPETNAARSRQFLDCPARSARIGLPSLARSNSADGLIARWRVSRHRHRCR